MQVIHQIDASNEIGTSKKGPFWLAFVDVSRCCSGAVCSLYLPHTHLSSARFLIVSTESYLDDSWKKNNRHTITTSNEYVRLKTGRAEGGVVRILILTSIVHRIPHLFVVVAYFKLEVNSPNRRCCLTFWNWALTVTSSRVRLRKRTHSIMK